MKPQKIRRVGIIHGIAGSSATHWQTWLARKCRHIELETIYPKLPEKHHPKLSAWLEALNQVMPVLDETTALVGHSLGCPAILQLLRQNHVDSVGLVVLVAPSSLSRVKGSEYSFVSHFYEGLEDVSTLRCKILRSYVYASDNDGWVDPRDAERVAKGLEAEFRIINGAGHLNVGAGYHTFPEVFGLIQTVE